MAEPGTITVPVRLRAEAIVSFHTGRQDDASMTEQRRALTTLAASTALGTDGGNENWLRRPDGTRVSPWEIVNAVLDAHEA